MESKIFFLILLLSYTASATPTLDFQHENIQPGETILATITTTGEFVEQIKESQIKFFNGRKQIFLETDIVLYKNTHYLSIYTTQEANLTLQIENILYKESNILQSKTISKNLTISKNILTNTETNETYTQILKIRPGHIFSTNPTLKLINVGNKTLNATIKEEISLAPLTSQEITFTPEETFSLTKISTYKDFLIPTIYLKNEENNSTPTQNSTTNSTPKTPPALKSSQETISLETTTDKKIKKTIQLFNMEKENITDLQISLSLDFIKTEKLQDMLAKTTQNLTLEINPETPGNFETTINISYTQNESKNILQIPLSIIVLPKGTTKKNFTESVTKKCDDIGQVCNQESICNGTAIFTDDYTKYCCQASCIPKKNSESDGSGFSWLVAIVILAVLGYIGHYFYKKQKSLKPQTSKDTLQKTSKRLENRLAGNTIKRTSGNLTKY